MSNERERDVMDARAPRASSDASAALTAEALRGATVHDRRGREVGRVHDVVESGDGTAESVVLDVGGYLGVGSRAVAVASARLSVREDGGSTRVLLGMTEDELRDLPEYQLPVTPPGVPPQPR